MALSPVQITLAADLDQESHGVKCTIDQMQQHQSNEKNSADHGMDDSCANNMDHGDSCLDHPSCIAHINFTPLQPSLSFLLSNRNVSLLKFNIDNDALTTHYPELLKRPPRV